MLQQVYFNQLIGTIVGGICGTLAIAGLIVFIVMQHKLKIERVKADALIRAEEIRAKNQLEIEKLLLKDHEVRQSDITGSRSTVQDEESLTARTDRSRNRI